MLVESFGGGFKRLFEKILIYCRQHRRIESHGVLDKQYQLYADLVNVFLGIELVFEQFDYGKQQVDIAEPAEYIVDAPEVFVGQTGGYAEAS